MQICSNKFKVSDIQQLIIALKNTHQDSKDEFDYEAYFENFLMKEDCEIFHYKDKTDNITGIFIIDKLDIQYAQIIIFCIHEDQESQWVQEVLKTNSLNNMTVELIQFRPSFTIRDTFIAAGFPEKERVKMIHNNLSDFNSYVLPPEFSLIPMSEQTIDIAGQISYQAHKARQSNERYYNYSAANKRSQFSKLLQDPNYNTYLKEASFILSFNNKYLGLVESIMMNFQNEEIPWIADIAILPDFQGKKLGKMLLLQTLKSFHALGFSKSGLSVTRSNANAYALYTSLGYEEKENFVEILCYT